MAAGFRHGVPVEVAYHLLDLHHLRGDSVVRGFIGMSLENPPHKKFSGELKSGELGTVGSSVADPGSGAFLTPGSGIRNGFFSGSRISDPGSQTHIF